MTWFTFGRSALGALLFGTMATIPLAMAALAAKTFRGAS